jgi:hypothetical protein
MHYVDPESSREGDITVDVAPDGFITSMHASGVDPETFEAQQYRSDIVSINELAPVGD